MNSDKRGKDIWDKIGVIASVCIPIALLFIGSWLSNVFKERDREFNTFKFAVEMLRDIPKDSKDLIDLRTWASGKVKKYANLTDKATHQLIGFSAKTVEFQLKDTPTFTTTLDVFTSKLPTFDCADASNPVVWRKLIAGHQIKRGYYISVGCRSKYGMYGKWQSFHPNGELAQTGNQSNGQPNGTVITWYASGYKESIDQYINGQFEGGESWKDGIQK
jgi:hypothetical protein